MEFKSLILPNGLNIVGEINELNQSAAVGFFVKTGSRDEDMQINGVSHFLEHMLFKGTDSLSALEVNAAFDRTGAQFNAFTSEENTVFYASVLPEYLVEVTDIWAQLMRPALRNDDFQMEKNVILEEIAMYEDMPHFDVMDKARSLHFKNHPCGNSVLGTNQTITDMTADQMRNYFHNRYSADNITVVCSGKFDWDSFCEIIAQKCGSWDNMNASRQTLPYDGTKERIIATKQNLNREHICMISESVSAQDPRKYAACLLSMILGDDTGSRYFWSLVDNALTETAAAQYEPMDGTGALYSYVCCSRENSEQVQDIIHSELTKLRDEGVTHDELTKARNKVLSSLTLKNEIPMGRLIEVGFNWTYLKKYKTIDEEISAIKNVTVEQINELAKQFDPCRYTRVILRPEK